MAYVIPKISDVQVSISTVHPQTSAGLNTTAIFVSGSQEGIKTYNFLDDVAADYPANSSVLDLATTVFAQDAATDAIQVITYNGSSSNQAAAPSSTVSGSNSTSTNNASGTGTTGPSTSLTGIAQAAYDYFFAPWDYALLADYNKADALALADVIENGGDDGKGFHLLFLQFNSSNQADASAFAKYTRTYTYYHPVEGESVVAALAGEAGGQATGSASWQFVSNLAGISPVNVNSATLPTALTTTQVEALEQQGFILYAQKGSYANFTGASNASGNYIDILAGQDWVKASLESAVQDALADVNGSGRTRFDNDGIAKVGAAMKTVLDQAYAQGIIATDDATGKADYRISLPKVDAVSSESKERRVLNDVKFQYNAAGEIAKVLIKGTAVA